MKPRIPLADPEQMTPEQREVYDAIVKGPRGRLVGPLRAVLLVPELADRWQKFGEQLRYNTSLEARYTELSIIVTARHWNSHIEWQIHAQAALAAGVPEAAVVAIRDGQAPDFHDEIDIDIYEYTRQLLSDGDVDDAVHARVLKRWGATGVVELTALIGYYTMVSMMLNAQAIPPVDPTALTLPKLSRKTGSGALTQLPPARSGTTVRKLR